MRFDASQQMRLGQHMKLAPRMIQSMEILQMPLTQLEERIAQELESNVTLEIDDEPAGGSAETTDACLVGERAGTVDAPEGPMTIDEGGGKDDFERLDSFEADNPEVAESAYDDSLHDRDPGPEFPDYDRITSRLSSGGEGDADAKALALNNTASRSASLQEQLREQWSLADVDEELAPLGEQIIGYIDDDGYLREPLATIIDRMPAGDGRARPSVEQMERALQALQLLLDPPGVAARNTRECLLLQVDAILDQRRGVGGDVDREGWTVVRRLIADHLEDLAQNRLPRIAEKSGLTMDAIKGAMEKMRLLSLAPARQLVEEPPSAIVPDAIVEYDADADRYVAYLNDSRLPNLRINQEYARLAKDRASPAPTREFVKKNLSNAAWLLDAVEQRRRTLLRVINVVV
ncbi:MAG: hypothetical protein ACK4WH_07615, partial [Phycisphaerales bacterium]